MTYSLALAGSGLYIKQGKDWKDSDKTPVSFSRKGTATVRYTGVELTLSLYGVSFSRKLNEPGHIAAEILITTEGSLTVDRLAEMLVRRPVSLLARYTETGETSTLAKDYYIHEIASQYQVRGGVNYIYVKLDIFSPDKLLTRNKYSQAYLGRQLFSDVTRETLNDFVLRYQASLSNGSSKATPIESRMQVDVGVLHHLGYIVIGRSLVGKEVPSQQEMIYPYLVQYNETFHEFLSRVAGRCGEVFYYENGHFNLGVHKQKEGPKMVSDAERIIYQRIASDPLTVPDYTRDSVKEWDSQKNTFSPGAGQIFTDPVAPGYKGFPSEAFPTAGKDEYQKYYHSEIAAEDHYMLLYRDKFARDSFMDYWFGCKDEQLMGMMGDTLNSTSLLELVDETSRRYTDASHNSGRLTRQALSKGNAALDAAALDGVSQYAVLLSKVSNSTGRWMTLNYYTDIKRKAQEQMRKMVCVDMGDRFMDIKLGDRILLPGQGENQYLVVRIEMTAPEEWQCNYDVADAGDAPKAAVQSQRFYAIPLIQKVTKTTWVKDFKPKEILSDDEDSDLPHIPTVVNPEDVLPEGLQQGTTVETENTDSGERTTITTVSGTVVTVVTTTTTWVLYPPTLPAQPFRQSGAQSAFVIDSGDPVSQGRVRVRYPWQPSIRELDQKVDKCQRDLDALQRSEDATKAEKDKAARQLRSAKETRMKYEAATPWIRMATPMATQGGGMYFKPEVGDEVMVDYENGNIERPFVVGTLYSKNLPAPADSRVIVSRNGHTIRMEDPTDESVLTQGLGPGLELLSTYGVKVPDLKGKTRSALGGIELTDKFGFYDIKMSSHERKISISSPFGDIRIGALTGISIQAPNGDINISGKNVNISAWNKINVQSGQNVKTGTDADRALDLSKTLAGLTDQSRFLDLALLRSLLEVLIRPVDGTLEIKSGRYLRLESGGATSMGESATNEAQWEALALEQLIRYAVGKVPRLRECVTAYNNAAAALSAVKAYLSEDCPADTPAPVTKPASAKELLGDMIALDYKTGGEEDVYLACMDYFTRMDLDPGCTQSLAEQLFERVEELGGALSFWKRFISEEKTGIRHIYEEIAQGALKVKGVPEKTLQQRIPKDFLKDAGDLILPKSGADGFSAILKKLADAFGEGKVDEELFADVLEEDAYADWETDMKRKVAAMIIEKCRSKEDNPFQSLQIAPVSYAPIQQRSLILQNGEGKDPSSVGTTITDTRPDNADAPFTDNDWSRYVQDIRLMGKSVTTQELKSAPREQLLWKSDAKAKGDILLASRGDRTCRLRNLLKGI